MDIKVLYHHNAVKELTKSKKGDWIDLRAIGVLPQMTKGVKINSGYQSLYNSSHEFFPGDSGLISLGVSIELPEGTEAIVAPRSSTFKTWGIIQTNSIGTIDNFYKGKEDIWWFPYFCLAKINALEFNDAICQFRVFENMPKPNFITVNDLDNENRAGIGASGRKGR